MTEPVLALDHVSKTFETARTSIIGRSSDAVVLAVRDVSLVVGAGEIVGLVGQSGSGKTTTGRIALRLTDPTAGRVAFAGQDITRLRGAHLRTARRNFQMIHQDPYQSLNPRMNVRQLLEEPLDTHERGLSRSERRDRVRDVLAQANLSPVDEYLGRYPYELSGGQRQRVAIARAVILRPRLVIADEPVSMLDVSIRIGILRLLLDLRDRLGTAQLFITHDLAIARHVCDRVAVMHEGVLVEEGDPALVFGSPQHPYTRSLLDALPERRLRARSTGSSEPGQF